MHVAARVASEITAKPLLAAIGAVASIRPREAEILDDLADSNDEDFVAAVDEVMAVAEGSSSEDQDGRARRSRRVPPLNRVAVEVCRMATKTRKPNQKMQAWVDAVGGVDHTPRKRSASRRGPRRSRG